MANNGFKLVTIICEPVLSTSLLTMIRSVGASGFTVTDVRGEGSGEKSSGELPGEKLKIEIVIGAELADRLLQAIAKTYFANYSLIAYAADIQIIRQEKF